MENVINLNDWRNRKENISLRKDIVDKYRQKGLEFITNVEKKNVFACLEGLNQEYEGLVFDTRAFDSRGMPLEGYWAVYGTLRGKLG